MKTKGFKEFTFQDPCSDIEVYVDIDLDTHQVIDCYMHKGDLKELRMHSDPMSEYKWRAGKNSLFVHCKKAAKDVLLSCYVIPENLDEYYILAKAYKRLNLDINQILVDF